MKCHESFQKSCHNLTVSEDGSHHTDLSRQRSQSGEPSPAVSRQSLSPPEGAQMGRSNSDSNLQDLARKGQQYGSVLSCNRSINHKVVCVCAVDIDLLTRYLCISIINNSSHLSAVFEIKRNEL